MNKKISIGIIITLLLIFTISYQMNLIGKIPITGLITGTATVTVSTSTTITLPVDTVAFGSLAPNAQSNTTAVGGTGIRPFVIQNDGNVDVNLTLSATDLWTTATNPAHPYFSYNLSWNESGTTGSAAFPSNNSASFLNVNTTGTASWRAVPGAPPAAWLANCTDFRAATDALNLNINVTVPGEEPAASRSSTLTILASQSASGADC